MSHDGVPSWEEVARRYGRKIYNFAYRLSGNPDDAADLAQEVLLRVRRGLATYKPGSFDGWLWRPPSRGDPSWEPEVSAGRTWLLSSGWRRHGLVDPGDVPGR